jgi:hypothetical protein
MGPENSIILCEPQCWGFEHASFNAALLQTALLAYPDARIVFMGAKDHLSCVLQVLTARGQTNEERVQWRDILIPPRMLTGWRRLAKERDWCGQVLRAANACNSSTVILCSVTETGLRVLKGLLQVSETSTPVLAVLHSMLAFLERRMVGRPWNWPLGLRRVLRLPHPRQLTYLVLGPPIHARLTEVMPEAALHSMYLDPPYSMADPGNAVEVKCPIRFGYFGTVNGPAKGFERFVRVAKETAQSLGGTTSEFVMVGFHQNRLSDPSAYAAVHNVSGIPLTYEEYTERALSVTYAVGTSDPDHYRLVASASFLDALCYNKPGIYLRNAYVEHYFGRLGDVGYLCGSYNEMRDLVFSIIECFPEARYRQQCENILRGRRLFEPQSVASRLRQIVTEVEEALREK